MKHPTMEEANNLLNKYVTSSRVKNHSLEVNRVSVIIGSQINEYQNIDMGVVQSGAILHDIGRHKYLVEDGHSYKEDLHEYETGRLLTELGYKEFGEMLRCHLLGGITADEARQIGYPEAVDMMPTTPEIKVISIADKVRPMRGIYTLDHKIEDYKTNPRLEERYFSKVPGLRESTIERVKVLWKELVQMGMKDPPIEIGKME